MKTLTVLAITAAGLLIWWAIHAMRSRSINSDDSFDPVDGRRRPPDMPM